MLKVEIGYYDFKFDDDEQGTVFSFARVAREHIIKEDKAAKILIKFEDDEEQEDK